MDFSHYLDRIRAVCDAHGHALHLNPGAAESRLEALEAELGFPISAHARQAWLLANGAERDVPVFMRPGYLTAYDFLPLEKAIAGRARMADRAPRYAGYKEPEPRDARIRDGWFHPGWLPFASFGGATSAADALIGTPVKRSWVTRTVVMVRLAPKYQTASGPRPVLYQRRSSRPLPSPRRGRRAWQLDHRPFGRPPRAWNGYLRNPRTG